MDEADSILLDEARMPLVIAGNVKYDEDYAFQITSIIRSLKQDIDSENGIEVGKELIQGLSSTCTYLINESPDQFSRVPALIKTASNMVKGSLFTVQSLYKKLFRRKLT